MITKHELELIVAVVNKATLNPLEAYAINLILNKLFTMLNKPENGSLPDTETQHANV